MPRVPRSQVFDAAEIGVYHCINRCVRGAYLCGRNASTGRNFEYRRVWIQERMAFLASTMGLDLLAFCVMDNHFHLMVRNRPDLVEQWSAEEVARRWYRLCPPRKPGSRQLADEPSRADMAAIVKRPRRLAEIRRRLSSVSWLMRFLAEPIARRANREDKVKGRFWEGRFKLQRLLDESAIAACMAYIDLNPIRAGIVLSPEDSRFTSCFERLQGAMQNMLPLLNQQDPTYLESLGIKFFSEVVLVEPRQCDDSPETVSPPQITPPGVSRADSAICYVRLEDLLVEAQQSGRAAWLSPLEITEQTVQTAIPNSRASNLGCLNMSFTQYLQLLEWTGRQWRKDKRGKIPDDLAPLAKRLGMPGESWMPMVQVFDGHFRHAAGRPESMKREALRRQKRWIQGTKASQSVFGGDSLPPDTRPAIAPLSLN